MSSHLDVYANCDSISTSTRDMWANLIKRWVRDYSWTRYKDDMMSEAKSDKLEDIGQYLLLLRYHVKKLGVRRSEQS